MFVQRQSIESNPTLETIDWTTILKCICKMKLPREIILVLENYFSVSLFLKQLSYCLCWTRTSLGMSSSEGILKYNLAEDKNLDLAALFHFDARMIDWSNQNNQPCVFVAKHLLCRHLNSPFTWSVSLWWSLLCRGVGTNVLITSEGDILLVLLGLSELSLKKLA